MSTAPEQGARYERGTAGASASTRATDQSTAEYRQREAYGQYEPEDYSTGPAAVGGWLLVVGGLWSFFVGLGIVIKKAYFTSLPGYASASSTYPYHWNIGAWGWANLIFGIVAVVAGACVLLGMNWARWTGIVLAVIGAIGTFVFLPFYPLWSIIVIAVYVFIIWALAAPRQRAGY